MMKSSQKELTRAESPIGGVGRGIKRYSQFDDVTPRKKAHDRGEGNPIAG